MKKPPLILIFFVFGIYNFIFPQTTIVFHPGPTDGKDALIWTVYPDSTFTGQIFKSSAWTWSGTSGVERSLVGFDLTLIPEDAIILSAELSLYNNGGLGTDPQTHSSLSGPNTSFLRRIIDEWHEDNVTWNNQPQTTGENQIVLAESTDPFQNYTDIDVMDMVQDMISDPSTGHGFMIQLETEEYYRRMCFATSDHLTDSLRPTLIITYNTCSVDLGNDTTICAGDEILLSPGFGYDTYLWQDGSADSVLHASTSGLYWVEITDTLGCVARDSIYIEMLPAPQLELGNDTTICSSDFLVLDPGNGFESYFWQDNSNGATFTVTETGLYWVEVENGFGCSNRDSIDVAITLGPDIWLGNDSTLCTGDTVSICADAGYPDYLWQDGSTDSCLSVVASGNYWVEVSDEFGCSGYDTINFNFLPGPDVSIGNDTLICFNEYLQLDAGEDYENYLWQDGSGGQTYLVTQAGEYWVEVVNECGFGSDTISVGFTEYFDVWLGNDTSFCYGQSAVLDAGEGFSSYFWNNGSTSQSIFAANTGNYWVEVSDSLDCTATDTIFIEAYMDFTISIGDDTVKICEGDYVFLNGPEGYPAYLWQDGSTYPTLLADTAGIYWLEVTDENGCAARDSTVLVLNIIPVDLLGNDTVICPDTELVLNARPGFQNYQWQDGSTESAFVTNHEGKFWVSVLDEIGCSGTDTILVSPFDEPGLSLADEEWICHGDSLLLDAGEGYLSYLWQDGSSEPEYLVTEEGFYKVEVETICGFYTDSVEVYFYEGNLDLGRDTILCDGEQLPLYPGPGYSDYYWSNGSTDSILIIGEKGDYWLKVFDGFCYISDSIAVDACTSIWIPNVFTPNGDEKNETFYAKAENPAGITQFKLTIFNRWGRIVYEMDDIDDKWDGRLNGNECSAGAYFWVCDYQALDKYGNPKNHSKQGSVTLIR